MQNKTKRPLSPHLQVYRPQITTVLSISHRAAGVFNLLGSLVFVCWLLALAHGPEAYGAFAAHVTAWYGQILLFFWTLSLFYHLCNGIRHLAWDAGHGFEIATATRSGIAVIIAALTLTALAWACALGGASG